LLCVYNYSSDSIGHISNEEEEKKIIEYAVGGERERGEGETVYILPFFSLFFYSK
jgi:hypothetical protein